MIYDQIVEILIAKEIREDSANEAADEIIAMLKAEGILNSEVEDDIDEIFYHRKLVKS
jgi:hypothetical protein